MSMKVINHIHIKLQVEFVSLPIWNGEILYNILYNIRLKRRSKKITETVIEIGISQRHGSQ